MHIYLYLNSKKVSLDENLTFDFSEYNVRGFNTTEAESADYGVLYGGHAEYTVAMEKIYPMEKGNPSDETRYLSMEINYIADENDGQYDELLSSSDYTEKELSIGGVIFTQYAGDLTKSYLKYEADDGYYLICYWSSMEEEIIAELTAMIA